MVEYCRVCAYSRKDLILIQLTIFTGKKGCGNAKTAEVLICVVIEAQWLIT